MTLFATRLSVLDQLEPIPQAAMSALSAGGQLARHDESSGKNQISSNAAVPYLRDGFQHKKRLPDRSKPWASGLCQANLLHLLLKIA